MTKAVLLRVGIDSGSGGIQGPLFMDDTFEFVCIPDKKELSVHKYGSCIGKNGRPHSEYFPVRQQERIARQHVHFDPEFETYTYGDPTTPKRSLRKLEKGDYLIFYAGLQRWDDQEGFTGPRALYIVGYFVVQLAGLAGEFSRTTLKQEFGKNYHVRYQRAYKREHERLVLVKGGPKSRLLKKATLISDVGNDRTGKPLKVLSQDAQRVFGDFGGKIAIQRSPPRWVAPEHVEKAIRFVTRLR